MWPEALDGPTDVGALPICGGDVTVLAQANQLPDWGGTYARLELEATCSRCRMPWWPGRIQLEQDMAHYNGWDITKLLEQGTEAS